MKRIQFLFIFLCCSVLNALHAQVITRGPYMTLATNNTIVIHWSTDIPATGKVQFGTNPTLLNNSFSNLSYTTNHIIQLTNLLPYTKYYYSIGTTTTVLQSDTNQHFVTLPFTSPLFEKPIRFWAVGDIGKQTQQQINVRESFRKYVGNTQIDGWILLGDNAYNSGLDIEYQNGFFNYYQQSVLKNIVLWPALGNHDYANNYTLRTTHQIPYIDLFTLPQNAEAGGVASGTERYYSFNYGNVHFVNLDSYGLENVGGNYYGLSDTLLSPQIQWLKNDLQANQLPWVIVSFHHPPYCMGTHNSDAEGDLIAIRTQLNPILERYNVDLVLNGHCHSYQRSQYIKGHFGLEASFDSNQHILQQTSGTYDGSDNSCAFVKNQHTGLRKDSGVIYMVVGSGGAIPQMPNAAWPHNAMQYSNYADNGSLLLTVEGNKLLAEWISTDTNQVVKDKFTIYKNVGKSTTIHTSYPDTMNLKASWKSNENYIWSTGDSMRVIQYIATTDTMILVQDAYSCITDTFFITNSPNAIIETLVDEMGIVVFPNPVHTELNIQLSQLGWYDATIYNLNGDTVLKTRLNNTLSKMTIPLQGKLQAGMYMLELKNESHHVRRSSFIIE